MNFFRFKDHKRIESIIRENVNYDWIIAYDVAPEIESIYVTYSMSLYDLKYSIQKKCKVSELMILKRKYDSGHSYGDGKKVMVV